MVGNQHIISRLNVEAIVPDLDVAMALRPRVEDLCWRLMPQALERVCEALLPKDLYLKLERIEIDLGTLRPSHLEDDALAALEAAFSEVLSAALLAARRAPSEKALLLSPPDAELRRLENYLVGGVLPFAGGTGPFDPFAALLRAAEEQPAALAAKLRRHAHNRIVLERLVRQLGEHGLPRLLSVLAPADAATILSLLQDVILVHQRTKPTELERMAEPALRELAWVTTLEFLLRDPGSQFNRRRFLRFLLEREARAAGIAYEALLGLLATAAEQVARRSLLSSSLPRTLAELLAESAPPAAAPRDEGLEALAVQLRRHAGDPRRLAALLAFAGSETLDALIRRLEPAGAGAILGDLGELEGLQAAASLISRTGEAFRRVVRIAAVAYLAAPGRTGFRRRPFWRAVIIGVSRQTGMPPSDFAAALRKGLATAAGRYPRLVGLMRDLAGFPLAQEPSVGDADDLSAAAEALRAGALAGPALERLLEGADLAALRRLVDHLTPASSEIFAIIARLTGGQADIGAARLERRSLMSAVIHLSELGARPFETRPWSRRLLQEMRSTLDSAEAEAIDSFLRTGRPRRAGASLPALLERDPEALAERLMRLARQWPERVPSLAERLLDWLAPRDLLALLASAPIEGGGALVAGGERAALLPLVEMLLRGRPLPGGNAGGTASLDRYALSAYWLAHGRLPSWAPAGSRPAALTAGLATLDPLLLAALLPDDLADRAIHRLRLLTWLEGGSNRDGAEDADGLVCLIRQKDPVLLGYLAAVHAQPGLGERLASLLERSGAPAEVAAMLPWDEVPAEEMPARDDPVPDEGNASLFAWLSEGGRGDEEMVRRFVALADGDDPALRDHLAAYRSRPGARRRWAVLLPPHALARLVRLLTPPGTRGLVEGVMLIGAAWRQLAPFGARRVEPAELWSGLLDRIAAPGAVDPGRVMTALMDDLTGGRAEDRVKLAGRVRRLARDGGHVSVRIALRPPLPASRPVPAPGGKTGQPAKAPSSAAGRSPPAPETDDPIYVANAGLVLFAPYLPALFQRLGLWPGTDSRRSRRDGVEDAGRAVHLLQYLADGRLDAPEVELVLNKILCGKPTAWPVERAIAPDPADLDLCDGMMKAMLSNWPPLRQSSVAALRETFLQREGRLRHSDGKWLLQVQRKTVDVLVDQIPWGFGIIYHGWMQDPLHVTW